MQFGFWAVLDNLLRCRVRWICDKADRQYAGED